MAEVKHSTLRGAACSCAAADLRFQGVLTIVSPNLQVPDASLLAIGAPIDAAAKTDPILNTAIPRSLAQLH